VLNVGPSKTSSFHVVGTIFDRVWMEGNPDNQFRGMQTVLLGSSNSAIVEFVIPENGSYIMVDHHFANVSQGAIGLISTAPKPTENDIEHHNLPSVEATPTEPDAVAGKLAFESKCLACHTIGQGKKLGPDIAGVTKRRTDDWLTRWLKSPETMLKTDADARAMLKEHNDIPMPNQGLSDAEIKQYIRYFHWIDSNPGATALACGVCVEDRVAAAYDHAVVTRSLEREHEVVFLAIEGDLAVSARLSREIRGALDSAGIDRGSARVSLSSASLSFAYDPKRRKLAPIISALEKSPALKGLRLSLLRVIA